MTVIKKTVALHPIVDKKIRKVWAALVEDGRDASYSTALNWMILEHVFSLAERGGVSKWVKENLDNFLDDEPTINDLNLEDYNINIEDLFSKKDKRRSG